MAPSRIFLYRSTNLYAFSRRDPPNVVFHRETVTVRAQGGHCNVSLSSRWRDDASQVVLARCSAFFPHPVLPLLDGFLYSVKDPFRGLYFSPESALVFLSTSQGDKALLHHSLRAISVIAALSLLQVFFGWRFQLPLTLSSCLFFLPALGTSSLYPFSRLKYFHTFLARIVLFPPYSKAFHGAPVAPRTVSTANMSVLFSPFVFRESLLHFWNKLVVYDSSPSCITTDANCQKLRVFRCTDCHNETSAFAEH